MVHFSLIRPSLLAKISNRPINATVKISTMRVLTHVLAIEDGVQLNQCTPATLTWARSDAGVPKPEPVSVTDAWAWLGSPSCGAPRPYKGPKIRAWNRREDDGYCKIYQCCYLLKEENASSDLVDWVSKKGLEIVWDFHKRYWMEALGHNGWRLQRMMKKKIKIKVKVVRVIFVICYLI